MAFLILNLYQPRNFIYGSTHISCSLILYKAASIIYWVNLHLMKTSCGQPLPALGVRVCGRSHSSGEKRRVWGDTSPGGQVFIGASKDLLPHSVNSCFSCTPYWYRHSFFTKMFTPSLNGSPKWLFFRLPRSHTNGLETMHWRRNGLSAGFGNSTFSSHHWCPFVNCL